MSLVKLKSGCLIGSNFYPIDIEVSVFSGLPNFIIIGLPDKQIDEAKERIRSAIKASGYKMPSGRVVVNLSPGYIPKKGTWYDLGIALAVLEASGQVVNRLSDLYFFGELRLDGCVISGGRSLPIPYFCLGEVGNCAVPDDMQNNLDNNSGLIYVKSLAEAVKIVRTDNMGFQLSVRVGQSVGHKNIENSDYIIDQIGGQLDVKRAIQIAIAGGHHIILSGPPGSGKTSLARAASQLLPSLSTQEVIRLDRVYSQLNMIWQGIRAPFRAPHHTIGLATFLGGGRAALPGEVALANGGILFLDEYPFFDKRIREALRQVIEDKKYTFRQRGLDYVYSTNFILILTKNTCPCGPLGGVCKCTHSEITRYSNALDGPILDRIDLYSEMVPNIAENTKSISGREMVKQINIAREMQKIRYNTFDNSQLNGGVSYQDLYKNLSIDKDALKCVTYYSDRNLLSMRSKHKVLRIARTIADLDNQSLIALEHVNEALMYRKRDVIS